MKHKREIIESKYPPKNNEDIWLKDLQLYASTTKGWQPLGSEKTYSNKTELLKDTPTGGTIGIDKETGTAYLYNDVSKEWTPVGGGGGGMTETTWQELKDKRDNRQLIPGSLYRITDYNCTTTQENTQSAGHQFDIVLLALSEGKLAEEGWAMMHDNDVYSIHCSDGVDIKVYINIIYQEEDEEAIVNMVLTDSHLGTPMIIPYESVSSIVDETTKTINLPIEVTSTQLLAEMKEELPYNYFQNSNLSAWKVWYCLDNDKNRFAWADDRVETVQAYITTTGSETMYHRNAERDRDGCFAWYGRGGFTYYTTSETPSVGDDIYYVNGSKLVLSGESVASYTPEEILDYYGRGVIYRLIDEWDNDVPYDFKNILVTLPKADESYLITAINHIDEHLDYSMRGSIRDITVSLCLINDGGSYKNAIPIGIIAPSLRYGEVIYNIKISSSALMGAGQLTDISSNTIIGYTI